MSHISEVSIRRPVFAWMLMIALLLFGYLAFKRMGISQLPDVDSPIVNVSLGLENASPEVMESDVIDVVEDALMTIQGVKEISSSARSGSANITVEFDLDRNIDLAVQDIENALGRIARRLPKDMDPPSVSKSNPEDQPILWLSVSTKDMKITDLMELVRDRVKDRFSTISGVSEVNLGGFVDPLVQVNVSREKLQQKSMTITDVIGALQEEHVETPAGRLELPEKEFRLRSFGEATSLKELADLPLLRRGGSINYSTIKISDVADVELGVDDIRRKSRSAGLPAVGLGIKKQRGSNAVEVADLVKARMVEVQKTLPPGVEIGVRFDSTEFIRDSVHELNMHLILSGVFTAIVCWLFLGSWSATLNVVLAIPTSVMGAFIVLHALGFTLNTFTLLGLSLAIGIVVDDAIMVLENIVKHRERGKNAIEAAIFGSKEIAFAAVAATVAIAAIFLPVAFMEGVIGKYLFQFGITLSVAVMFSLLEALTITPMRCSQFLTVSERHTRIGRAIDAAFRSMEAGYERIIPTLLRKRWIVLAILSVTFVLSLTLFKKITKEFVPAQDQSRLLIRLRAPVGSSLAYTDQKMQEIERILDARPEVAQNFSSVGGFGGGDVNTGMIFLTLKPRNERKLSQQELIPILQTELKEVKGIRATIQDQSQSGFGGSGRGFPVEYSIRGGDWDKLAEISEKMIEAMKATGIYTDVDSNYTAGTPEVQFVPNREQARSFGVSVSDIGSLINAMVSGVVAGKYTENGRRLDIRVRMREADRKTLDDLKKLYLRNNRGELVPLSRLVQVVERKSLQAIYRQNRQRSISVFSNIAPKIGQDKAIAMVEELAKKNVPEGYYIVTGGNAQALNDSFRSLYFALILGLVISYMVLGVQFNSFLHPISVLIALPFSISGGLFALYLSNSSLNIYSMIGFVLLMGIVKKNSILLVDFTNQVRESGKDIREALKIACPGRLRPILMTSFATIAGAIPPALAFGPGSESRAPMAIAVIGGVLLSTFLTLFAVPCVYVLLSKFEKSNKSN